ncbi:MAG: thioredoxin-like domain-containing protein [Gemmataceae bacterium]
MKRMISRASTRLISIVGCLILASSASCQPARAGRAAPELDGGVAWLNTAGPVKLHDLRGKVVVLDFWTFCCINCIHTLPDLAKLEKKYENELVVVGVHSAKFENERKTDAIRKAILRYQISHPVVNDAELKIWNRFGVGSWPTLILIDPEGNIVGHFSGEGQYDRLDQAISKLVKDYAAKGTLDRKLKRFDLARYREKGDTPLFFPGKVFADARSDRLFISDSTHHRVVITDLAGRHVATAGTGEPGFADGSFSTARFDDPQGLAIDGDELYVADRKNHSIRALNLKEKTVRTIAGTGQQNREGRGSVGLAKSIGLNSPWDLLRIDRSLYIAMAGHHQIWIMDLTSGRISPFAGSGLEAIHDGEPREAAFAQPSGLASDGKRLFVADSESSAIRTVELDPKKWEVRTLVGMPEGNLFNFGDVDGTGEKVRLQHPLGVVYHEGALYVSDTYNSKLKIVDPLTAKCSTWIGGPSQFDEPAGLSVANGKLYVADTNAHRIRVVDLKTKDVSTLNLTGVEPPRARTDATSELVK